MQKSSNFNWRALYGLLFISGALGTFGFCQDALAADSPTVEVLIGNQSAGASHEQTLKPTKTVGDAKIISVPVTIKMTGTSSYGVGVSLDCSGSANATECAKSALIGNDAAHTPLKSVTTPTAKGSLVNAWGFYSDGNNTTTPADNVLFKAIPTSANANNIIDNSQGTYNDGLSGGNGTKNLYLHFAAGVDGTQPSATYTGKIVVTAVAQPIDVAAKLEDGMTMQEATAEQCTNMTAGEEVNLIDDRLNKTSNKKFSYKVGKLADGKCWMLQNLALESGTALTPGDSDIDNNYTLPGSDFIEEDVVSTGHIDNTDDTVTRNNRTNGGTYYSYSVATAGTGTGSTNYHNATSSICPKNWRLPTSYTNDGGEGDFTKLYAAYNSNQAQLQTALHRAATGVCYTQGGGYCPLDAVTSSYWSSTIKNASTSYGLVINTSSVNPTGDVSRSSDKLSTIRCVMR